VRDELRKRILYIENGVGFGGAVISLRAFLANCDLERFPAILLHSLDDPKFGTFDPRIRTVRAPKVVLERGRGASILRKANLDVIAYAARIMRVAVREGADCLYLNNDLVTNLAGLIAGRALRLPVVQHERDIPAPISRLATSLCSKAERALAISGPVRAALEKMGYPRDRIRMVPEGLELERFQPLSPGMRQVVRDSLGLGPTDRAVAIVGMVMEWKGQHVLIDAAPSILERHPSARFLIVGESPRGSEAYAMTLRERVERLGLRECVRFTGYRPDIPNVIDACDVLVHASTSPEPFGRVVIEGMAMSRPVIATNIGAPPEIIRHGETGLLVPPAEPERLADAVNDLFDDDARARRIGDAARSDVASRYSIQRHAWLIESVFEEIFWGAPRALTTCATV
jgi:glycosyltransferase involved in cell wall biosynthesis